jgi:fructokinase
VTAPEVLVIGEALVDVVEQGGETVEHPGGSAANVALGLGRLGIAVELLTHLGDDPRGRAITQHLGDSGVQVRPESVAAPRTSTAVASIGDDGSARYVFDVSWDFHRRGPRPAPRLLHVGSFAAFGTEPDELLAFIQDSGADEVSIDPNVRPALAGDHARARRRFESIAAACTVVKLSDEDAEWLYPERRPEAVLDGLLDGGARLAVLTQGARGLRLAAPSHRVSVPAPSVRAVDTIGAGDTVMASVLADVLGSSSSALNEADLGRLGTRAARAAAVTVARAGADLPWSAELPWNSEVA